MLAYLSGVSVRMVAGSVVIFDAASPGPSSYIGKYIKLPTAANQQVAGIVAANFFEPPIVYSGYATGDDPTAVNGTAWAGAFATFGIGMPILLKLGGEQAECIAAGTVATGDVLFIADIYGRVNNLANLITAGATINPGDTIYPVGVAQAAAIVNGFVVTALDFTPSAA
jgi:hypothetical protein